MYGLHIKCRQYPTKITSSHGRHVDIINDRKFKYKKCGNIQWLNFYKNPPTGSKAVEGSVTGARYVETEEAGAVRMIHNNLLWLIVSRMFWNWTELKQRSHH